MAVKNRQLETAKRDAARHGIQIALSNPCFEVWFLLHFKYRSAHMKDYQAVLTQLKAYLPDYEKTARIVDALSARTETALRNVEQLEIYHKGNGVLDFCSIEVNPYTSVYKLMTVIL